MRPQKVNCPSPPLFFRSILLSPLTMARVLSLSLLLVAFVATASLSSASVIETNSLAVRQDGRDESFPACDNEDGSIPDGAPQQSTLTAWDTHPSADQIGHHHYWSGHDHGHEHDHHHHHNGDVQPYRTSDDPVVSTRGLFGESVYVCD